MNLEIIRELEEYKINNLLGFIEFAKLMQDKGYIWFRGQKNSDWDIIPGLSRYAAPSRTSDKAISSRVYVTLDFNGAIDAALEQINTNPKYQKIKNLGLSRLQIMLLAQHHGLITPILDWTLNPAVALYFALYEESKDDSFSPVIYATNPGQVNYNAGLYTDPNEDQDIDYPINADDEKVQEYLCEKLENVDGHLKQPNSFQFPVAVDLNNDFSHRITAQNGKFMIAGPLRLIQNIMYKYTPRSDAQQEGVPLRVNVVANIEPDAINELRDFLAVIQLNESTLQRDRDPESKLLDTLFTNINNDLMKKNIQKGRN